MKKALIVREEAEADLAEAFQWYEEQVQSQCSFKLAFLIRSNRASGRRSEMVFVEGFK